MIVTHETRLRSAAPVTRVLPRVAPIPARTETAHLEKGLSVPVFSGAARLQPGHWQQLAPKPLRFKGETTTIGDVILGSHDRTNANLNALEERKKRIWDAATQRNKWLDPQAECHTVVADHGKFLKFFARGGFLSRYRYFGHGQELYRLERSVQKKPVFEMMTHGIPSYSFMLDYLPLYAQSAIMARTIAGSDFAKNNRFYASGRQDMLNVMGRHKDEIAGFEKRFSRLKDEDYIPLVGQETLVNYHDNYGPTEYKEKLGQKVVEDFLNQVESIKWLINFTQQEARPLMDTKRAQEVRAELQGIGAFPHAPERDILGFIIEHSPVLQDWQRRTLSLIRDECYYFAHEKRTDIMRKGWQTFWMQKIMHQVPGLIPSEEIAPAEDFMRYYYLRPSKKGIQPDLMGAKIWEDIYRKASLGILDKDPATVDWEKVMTMEPDEDKAIETLRNIRHLHDDESFVKRYLSPWVGEELGLYGVDTNVVSTKAFETIKTRIEGLVANGGQPVIDVVDANYEARGEMMLKHIYKGQDLKIATAKQTLKVVQGLWGKPVYLTSRLTEVEDEKKYKERVEKRMAQEPAPTPEELEREVKVKPVIFVATGRGDVELFEIDGTRQVKLNDEGKRPAPPTPDPDMSGC
jgi:stage V sporulation protein R